MNIRVSSLLLFTIPVYPRNLIQMLAIERRDYYALREATTGIASGMLTTG